MSDTQEQAVVDGRACKYFFKTEKIRDEEGKVIGAGRKHPDVEAVLPEPTAQEIYDYLNGGGKVSDMIKDAVFDIIFQAGRNQINDWLEKNPEGTFTATEFDLDKLTLEYIANLPKGQRGAWSPSDEDLKTFCEDYTMVLINAVQYDPKKVKVHCEQFLKGLAKLKNDKVAVQKMKDFLQVYATNTENMDDNEQVYGWLIARADKYLAAEEKNFADAL